MSRREKSSGSAKATKGKEEQSRPEPLPGQPGYRTRSGRSGLDPIDNRTEAAHSAGIFLRRLVTGRLIVENVLLLVLMGLFGVMAVLPLFFGVSEAVNGRTLAWDTWVLFVITGALGILLLIHFVISLTRFARRK